MRIRHRPSTPFDQLPPAASEVIAYSAVPLARSVPPAVLLVVLLMLLVTRVPPPPRAPVLVLLRAAAPPRGRHLCV